MAPPILCLALSLCGLLQDGEAPLAAEGEEPRTGAFQAVFDEPHRLSPIRMQRKRFRWPAGVIEAEDPQKGAYELSAESFRLFVPESYDPARPPGVLVWISPADTGEMPQGWHAVLARHNLIAVGADRSGNDRFVWYRAALALDAVHNVGARYTVDPERIYVSGFSGGGRMASRMGIHYADVFTGGIYMGGCNFWEDLDQPGPEGLSWPGRMPKPAGTSLGRARSKSRHVLLIGDEDFNRDHSRAIFEALTEKKRFAHVTWLEMPRTGHTWPAAEWLEEAVVALDAPLVEGRAKEAERGRRKAEREGRGGESGGS